MMTTEKRLIDAKIAMSFLKEAKVKETGMFSKGTNKGLNVALSMLGNREIIPTVDAVEVVRCKDCKHGMKSHLQPPYAERTYLCRHSWEGEYHKPDHFCSYGERKVDA